MTTNTDLHVAMPELPEPEAWRTRHKSEPGMMGNYPWTYTGRKPMRSMSGSFETENLYTAEQVRAAIQQAAVPEGWKLVPVEPTVEMLDAGYVADINAVTHKGRARWKAMLAAAPKQQPALGVGEGGGVPQWLPIETAPRDGSMIMLGRAASEELDCEGISVPGFWQEGYEDGEDYMGCDSGFVDVNFQQLHGGRSMGAESHRYAPNQPTHWMPLPPAPTGQINPDSAGQGMEGGEK